MIDEFLHSLSGRPFFRRLRPSRLAPVRLAAGLRVVRAHRIGDPRVLRTKRSAARAIVAFEGFLKQDAQHPVVRNAEWALASLR